LSEWEAYDRLDPIGSFREDFRTAQLSSIVINTARALYGKKGVKMTAPIDFMPEWGKEEEQVVTASAQTTEEMRGVFQGIARVFKERPMPPPPKSKKVKK